MFCFSFTAVGIAITNQNKIKTYNSDNIKIKKGDNDKELIIEMLHPTLLIGDIKIEFFTTKQRIKSKVIIIIIYYLI